MPEFVIARPVYAGAAAVVVGLLMLLPACDGASIDGDAQSERRDSTEYFHTSYPATNGTIAEAPAPVEAAADSAGGNAASPEH